MALFSYKEVLRCGACVSYPPLLMTTPRSHPHDENSATYEVKSTYVDILVYVINGVCTIEVAIVRQINIM
jgi:hypothetical protein